MENHLDSIIACGTLKPSKNIIYPKIEICKVTEEDIKAKELINYKPQSISELNTMLKHIGFPTIHDRNDLFDIVQQIGSSNISSNNEIKLIQEKLEILNKFTKEEEELDLMEIKLSKLKMQYGFISNMNNFDINSLKNEIEELSRENLNIPINDIKKLKDIIYFLKSDTFNENGLLQFISSNMNILKYFNFIFNEECLIKNIEDEEKVIASIHEQIPDTLERKIILALIENKDIYLADLCMIVEKEKYEIMDVLNDMEFHNVIVQNRRTERISLKKLNIF